MEKVTASGPRAVLFVVPAGVHLLDVAGPAQVFHTAQELGADYNLQFVGVDGQVTSAQGMTISDLVQIGEVDPPAGGDLVIVCGAQTTTDGKIGTPEAFRSELLGQWLRDSYATGATVASVCSAALALIEAGILNEKQCTTHWSLFEYVRSRYPSVQVQREALFVEDGTVITSAGITSGIDMALHLVNRDYGPQMAARVAQTMVVYMRRNGAADQNSVYLQHREHLHFGVHVAQDFLIENSSEAVSLRRLSGIAAMSVRSLERNFKRNTGLTPNQYQQQIRLEKAAKLFDNPELTIEAVANLVGFKDPRHFRRLWIRKYGQSPSTSRKELSK